MGLKTKKMSYIQNIFSFSILSKLHFNFFILDLWIGNFFFCLVKFCQQQARLESLHSFINYIKSSIREKAGKIIPQMNSLCLQSLLYTFPVIGYFRRKTNLSCHSFKTVRCQCSQKLKNKGQKQKCHRQISHNLVTGKGS